MRIPYLPLLRMSTITVQQQQQQQQSTTSTVSRSTSSAVSEPLLIHPLLHPITVDTYIIGLNAALQKRFVIDSIVGDHDDIIPGNVYRASSISYGVGGKGQDVAYTLHCLQYNSGRNDEDVVGDQGGGLQQGEEQGGGTQVNKEGQEGVRQEDGTQPPPFHLVQFIGTGYEGDTVYTKMSKDLTTTSSTSSSTGSDTNTNIITPLSTCTIRNKSTLRTCTSIVTPKSTTELIDPSGSITKNEITELLSKVQHTATATTAASMQPQQMNIIQSMCFMGSMPPGCTKDLYAKIYNTITTTTATTTIHNSDNRRHRVLCFIDSVVGLQELLQQISTGSISSDDNNNNHIRTILKINVAELCRYVNVPIQKEADGVPRETVVDAVTKFWQLQQQHQQQVSSIAAVSNDDDNVVMTTTTIVPPNVIALTNGAHPAYLAIQKQQSISSSSSSMWSFDLYQLPIVSPFSVVVDNNDKANDNTETTTATASAALPSPALYPIGAGDAVAAGTFAAWNYYVASTTLDNNDSDNDANSTQKERIQHLLPLSIRQVLDAERVLWKKKHDLTTSTNNDACIFLDSDDMYRTCFQFGLACGSASCIQEENSIVSIPHVLQLFHHATTGTTITNSNDRSYLKSKHLVPTFNSTIVLK